VDILSAFDIEPHEVLYLNELQKGFMQAGMNRFQLEFMAKQSVLFIKQSDGKH
jgi:hypothetical protein